MPDEKKAPSIEELLDEAAEAAGGDEFEDEGEVPDAPWMKSDEDLEKERLEAELRRAEPRRTGPLRRGDKVTGTVVHVGAEDIFVDIGGKAEALLASAEMLDADGNVAVELGEVLTLYVQSSGGEEVRLSYKMALEARDREAVRQAYAEHSPIQGKIASRRKGGFDVRFQSGQRAFLPLSQLEIRRVEDEELDDYVGRTFDFLITKYESDGKDLVVSRSQLLREEQEVMKEELLTTLAEGQIRSGTVSRIVDFGAFVDLGGVDGLVHISEVVWGHEDNPLARLRPGQQVKVKVLRIDRAKGTIGLSIRETEGHPWEKVGDEFEEGGVYPGRVTRVEAYGAFVELAPGLEGLVHVSELAWERVRHAESVCKPGDEVTVKLIRVEHDKKRLGLSIKALGGDPWTDIVPAWMRGQILEGTVDKVAPFGVFVQLAPGVNGLIHSSELGMDEAQAHLNYQRGKAVTVELADIDRERRRIRLLPSDEEAAGERAALQDYVKKDASANLGTFGDLLKGKLDLDD